MKDDNKNRRSQQGNQRQGQSGRSTTRNQQGSSQTAGLNQRSRNPDQNRGGDGSQNTSNLGKH